MSLIRKFAVSCTPRGLLGALFSALLALALFDPGAATAQEAKQIKLTEKHIQGFMAASKDMGKLYQNANPDKPDPKVEARAAAIAKKSGFASLDEYDDASMNISMIFSGAKVLRPARAAHAGSGFQAARGLKSDSHRVRPGDRDAAGARFGRRFTRVGGRPTA